MKTVLVTGAAGFIGRNLVTALERLPESTAVEVLTQTRQDLASELEAKVLRADIIFHLAGANRPENESDFKTINTGLTQQIVTIPKEHQHTAGIVLTSSAQADRDNPYGKSKKAAEDCIIEYVAATQSKAAIYRLPGVFGKWSRPNYNTVVATFCHNISRDLPISISDPACELELVYVDDVVRCLLGHLDSAKPWAIESHVPQTHRISLGELAERLRSFKQLRKSLVMPDVSDLLTKYLYSTYLTFIPEDSFGYPADLRADDRGWLFELAKSPPFGQIFVSTTKPGITRGNHYHDTKTEKFCLIQGKGIIRFRRICSSEILEYPIDDQKIQIVDIPPGYTHSIENTGDQSMIVLFWANEIFDSKTPDTYWDAVRE